MGSPPIGVFLSYNFRHQPLVSLVYHYLRHQPGIRPHFFTPGATDTRWKVALRSALGESAGFVLFLGSKLGRVQEQEMKTAQFFPTLRHLVSIELCASPDPDAHDFCKDLSPIAAHEFEAGGEPLQLDETHLERLARRLAQEITRQVGQSWREVPDPPYLPEGYPFDYEKTIIDAFIENGGQLSRDKVDAGCTAVWPAVSRRNASLKDYRDNPVDKRFAGDYRGLDAAIVADARAHKLREKVLEIWQEQPAFLTFPEAGPRAQVCYPLRDRTDLRVGILVSGGIAPGINAVIDGIVNRHTLYANPPGEKDPPYDLEILGFVDGLQGLLHGAKPISLKKGDRLRAHTGGSLLRTSREDELLRAHGETLVGNIVTTLNQFHQVDILYVIGGDGSMRAAHAIYTVARRKGVDLSVVTVPKTMDNDILWVWQSFGFLSAVEQAKAAIYQLYVEASSNPRLCVIQLFGSDSGFVASHAALTSGVCDYVLIPEVGFNLAAVIEAMTRRLQARFKKRESPYGMIVMAETAIPRDYQNYYKQPAAELTADETQAVDDFVAKGGRVHGQTPDKLRSAALKIVAGTLEAEIRRIPQNNSYWSKYRVFKNEPRHLIRAISPSAIDVIFGERLGTLVVDGAMAGYSDFMVSQWLTEYVFVPLKLVVLGRKRVPPKGIFWRTVLADTGQKDETVPPWPEPARGSGEETS